MKSGPGISTIWFALLTALIGFTLCAEVCAVASNDISNKSDKQYGQNISLQELLEQVEKRSDEIDAFQCRFKQEKILALFANPVTFHGELTVDRPDKLRWEFHSPIPSVLVLNGERGLRCTDQVQPISFDLAADPVLRTVAEQLWLWLGGSYKQLKETYRIKAKGEVGIEITPLESSIREYVAKISITFDPESKQPDTVEILEPGGDLTRLFFYDYSLNPGLSDQLFTSCTIDE